MTRSIVFTVLMTTFIVSTAWSQLTDEIFVHDGLTRHYKLYLPDDLPPNAPLVMVLHGYIGTATAIMNSTHMNDVADAHGFAVCYPQGTVDFSGTTHWNIGFANDPVDDLGFLVALAENLQIVHGVDPSCTYVCGMSNGGMMSYYLGCAAPSTFRAFASVTGALTTNFVSACSGNITVPFMEFHGTNDIIVPYGGGGPIPDLWGSFFGIESVFRKWYQANSCQDLNVQAIPEAPVVDFSSATRYDLTNCDGSLKSTLYKIENGGHTWPGSPSAGFWDFLQPTNQDVDASEEIWNFFSSVCSSSSGLGGQSIAEAPVDFRVYPNPAEGQTTVELIGADRGTITVYAMDGKPLMEQALDRGTNVMDLSQLGGGVYILSHTAAQTIGRTKLVVR